ncbi:MAG TPA: SH3 domain-containing C40 family peptidase [Chloroflexia bacterium]|nr:SH3 domain-containing C40 family peptidase [Chloroflexia bacterium]
MNLSTRLAKNLGAAGLSLFLLAGIMAANPTSTYAAPPVAGAKAVVTNTDGDPIRIREGAGTGYDKISASYEGEVVNVLEGPVTDGAGIRWYKIETSSVTGWMMAAYLAARDAPAQAPAAQQAPAGPTLTGYVRVANSDGDPVRMRASAARNGAIVAKFAPNSVLQVHEGPVADAEGIAWYRVSADGHSGWMMAEFLAQADAPAPAAAPAAPAEPAAQPAEARTGTARGEEPTASSDGETLRSSIVSRALRHVGARYRFGGTGPNAFDCSGFVYYVLNNSGFRVGRDMGAQLASGRRISTDELLPGDLVFFVNTYKRGLSHAGIYVGNGKFVHAENESTGVLVSSLWSAYWSSHYYTAVRLR